LTSPGGEWFASNRAAVGDETNFGKSSMKIAVLPGDDIGPEITEATLAVLEAADRRFALDLGFEVAEVGMAAHRRTGTTLPPEVVETARNADGIILGPCGVSSYPPESDGGINVPRTIRKTFDLYANIRPARSRPPLPRAVPGLDCLIVRENTEGFYADRSLFHGPGEFMPTPDCALSFRKITAQASRRIAKIAFDYANHRRGRITVAGKRHILPVTDGLFFREVKNEALLHPNVTWREMDIDAMAADLYTRPGDHDVILTTNMFGDILSNVALALSGSLGLAQSLNMGECHAAANAGHGSAPDIAGRGTANPTGLMLSAAMLLRWLGERHQLREYVHAAASIEAATDVAMYDQGSRTADLGGSSKTQAFTKAVIRAIRD
jgi:3-isopropylmalate dehydrogenase